MKYLRAHLLRGLALLLALTVLSLIPSPSYGADETSQVLMLRKVFSAPVYSWEEILKQNKKLIDKSFFERVEQRISWSLDNGQVEDAVRFAYVGDLAGGVVERKTGYRMQLSMLFRRLGNIPMALDLVSNIIVFEPENKEARFYKASLLQDAKNNLASYPLYEELAKEGYKRSECYYRMALLEEERQEYEMARDHFKECLKLDSKHELAKKELDRLEKALATATFIPKTSETGKSTGTLDIPTSSSMPIAISDSSKAQALVKDGNTARINFEISKASDLYRQAIALDPKSGEAHMYLGTILLREGQIEEALQSLNTAATLTPDSGEIQRYLGYCYEARFESKKDRSDWQKASDCFAKAKLLTPQNDFIDWDIERLQNM